uniref:Beta-amylase n=1 Tax=Rhizophora mucronata TaxID=61149 RepID=A0A2P2QZU5_RHIMU
MLVTTTIGQKTPSFSERIVGVGPVPMVNSSLPGTLSCS